MKDFAIKCTSPEQGQDIKAHIESLGIDTMEWEFCEVGAYYGVIDDCVDFSWHSNDIPVITLPGELGYSSSKPDNITLSDNGLYWIKTPDSTPEPAKYNSHQDLMYTIDGGIFQIHQIEILKECSFND
jgi:hypothetical protein